MRFKQWFNESLTNPLEIKKAIISKKDVSLVPDGDNFKIGWEQSNFHISPKYRSIQVSNFEPTSNLFKKLIRDMKPIIPDIEDWGVSVVNLSHARTGKLDPAGKSLWGQRKVKYYLTQPDAETTKFLYHGTSTEFLDEIKTDGLKPRGQGIGSYGADMALSKGDRVYLAVHPDAATRNAALQAAQKHGGFPLILKIDSSKLDRTLFGPDEDAETFNKNQNTTQTSIQFMGTLSYQGTIPAKAITLFVIGKFDKDKNTWTWERPKNIPSNDHPILALLDKGTISKHDTPYMLALFDKGIIDDEGNKAKNTTNEDIREAIRDSRSWLLIANKMKDDIHDWGMKGIKGLRYHSIKSDNPEIQKILDMIIKSELFYVSHDEFGDMKYRPNKNIIALAKEFAKNDLNYADALKVIFQKETNASS